MIEVGFFFYYKELRVEERRKFNGCKLFSLRFPNVNVGLVLHRRIIKKINIEQLLAKRK